MSESTRKRKMGRKSARQLPTKTVHSAYPPKNNPYLHLTTIARWSAA